MDAIGDEFVSCPDDIRIARIIRFKPAKREVTAETRTSGPFNRAKIEKGEISATDEEILKSDLGEYDRTYICGICSPGYTHRLLD